MITALHILGQVIVGIYFIYSGYNHFVHHKDLTGYATMMKVPMAGASVYGTGALMVLGGLGVLFNQYLDFSILLLVVFLVPTSFMMHAFWKSENPGEKQSQRIAFLKNIAIVGALLMLVA